MSASVKSGARWGPWSTPRSRSQVRAAGCGASAGRVRAPARCGTSPVLGVPVACPPKPPSAKPPATARVARWPRPSMAPMASVPPSGSATRPWTPEPWPPNRPPGRAWRRGGVNGRPVARAPKPASAGSRGDGRRVRPGGGRPLARAGRRAPSADRIVTTRPARVPPRGAPTRARTGPKRPSHRWGSAQHRRCGPGTSSPAGPDLRAQAGQMSSMAKCLTDRGGNTRTNSEHATASRS